MVELGCSAPSHGVWGTVRTNSMPAGAPQRDLWVAVVGDAGQRIVEGGGRWDGVISLGSPQKRQCRREAVARPELQPRRHHRYVVECSSKFGRLWASCAVGNDLRAVDWASVTVPNYGNQGILGGG